jgi:Uncharacterized protein conserved in bacteria C-term(DUF2220)
MLRGPVAAERPLWLDEEAEIRALLGAALNLFDRQRGSERQRRIHLGAEAHLPALARADVAADQTWSFVRELQRLGVLIVRRPGGSPLDLEWKGAKIAFAPDVEETLRQWLGRDWSEPAAVIWRRAVAEQAAAFRDGGAALAMQRIVIENRSAADVVGALASAKAITGPVTLRQLSATLFWGNSKILDDRGDLVAASFPGLEIRERTLVIAAHLPARCDGVLFIENQDTYTAAVAGSPGAAGQLALVYASGFRGSAARVRTRPGSLLHYAGPGRSEFAERFEAWWYEDGPAPGPAYFWGDLDFAGMQIVKALRSRFAGLSAWQPGYEPMRLALGSGAGGYGVVGGQVDPGVTGCVYSDSVLLPAIRRWGQRDQEALSP